MRSWSVRLIGLSQSPDGLEKQALFVRTAAKERKHFKEFGQFDREVGERRDALLAVLSGMGLETEKFCAQGDGIGYVEETWRTSKKLVLDSSEIGSNQAAEMRVMSRRRLMRV